ncbi:disease resistance protein RPV1-like [Eucalyptus grandis]|uniref:disease resistance protein RPV1-like n=1 Tax=Eucalyptus grandis TaxID=71139 RepID=UPI00192EA2B5|nr:disease resistance protein RPV1-like [Eucalyptus grandis]
MLILEHCAHLEEINTSIGDVKRLISLNLSSCRSLEKLPKQLGELENLEELVIDRTWIKEIPPCIGSLKKLKRLSAMYCLLPAEVPSPVSSLLAECYKLQQIPSSIGKLGELVELDLSNTWIKELPESIGELKKLKILRIFCSQIEELPSSIGKLQSLQEFDADGCFYLKAEIHVDKGGLSSLKTLCLGRAKISCLPENLDQLSSLEHLNLLGCRDLQSLPKLPFSLSCLRLTHESNELPSLSHLKHLKELVLWLCKSLQSIPELPSCIRKLCVERCPKLERLPKLSDLEFLSELGLVGCNGLKKLDGLEALKSLGELNPSRESELFNLDDFVAKVDKLHAIPGLEKLGSLEVVDISGCKHIEVLDLSKSKDLKELIVRNCESLVEIHCPSNFLEHFDRHGCKSLKKLPAFLPPDRARFNYRTFTTCPHGRKLKILRHYVWTKWALESSLSKRASKKMPNLKFLHVKDVDFGGDFEGLFSELRWLKWERRRDSFEVTNFHFEKLVILDLSDGDISEKWRGWSSIKMERLKVLDLSRCSRLKSTPNLSAFKNLKMLILKDCAHLKEIDPSIGDVKHLVSLNLRCCWSLKKLSEQLGKLENLEELVIDHIGMREIPPCIGSLKKLKRLSASWSWRSTEVPSSIIHPVSSLLTECYKLEQINSSIGKLGELVELDLSDTGIKELPESIGELTKLKILRICNSQIQRLPSSIGKLQSLQELDADECHNLEGQILIDEGGLSSLKTVRLGCTKISGLPENLDQLYSLEHLDLIGCGELQSLPKPPFSLSSLRLTCRSNELPLLSHLKHLKELTLHFCMSLQSIPELPSCIRTLHVWGCPKLERLPKLCDLEFLSKLGLAECNGLKKLDGVEALKSLRVLDLSKGREWSILNDFDAKEDNLHAIQGLEKLGSLEVVDISARKHIQVLDLSKSKHLKTLIVRDCKSLVEIRCPSKFLEHFDRDGCESLKKLPNFLPHGELWSDLDEEAY